MIDVTDYTADGSLVIKPMTYPSIKVEHISSISVLESCLGAGNELINHVSKKIDMFFTSNIRTEQ